MKPSQHRPLAKDVPFWKLLVLINGAVPLVLLGYDASRRQLGGNAVNFAIHTTGIMSLLFLVFSLAATPVRRLTGWNEIIALRRSLGLFAFFYACVHLALYVEFDRAMNLASTVDEIVKRRYLQVGFAALILMAPLAVTSTNTMMARLGSKRWKLLHRLAYVAAALGALHYFLLVKSDVRQPIAFAGVLSLLLAARVVWYFRNARSSGSRPMPDTQPTKRRSWTGELQITHLVDETPTVRTFRLASAEGGHLPFVHQPGQYLSLQVTIDDRKVNRCYTIASSPTTKTSCELSMKRDDSGIVSRHLHQQLQVGDRLRITAPAGKFIFTGTEADGVVLIAGGVGITPLMSITRYLTAQKWAGEVDLFFAAKNQQEIIFRSELDLLQKQLPNLHVHVTLTQAELDENWSGHRGRITGEWLMDSVADLNNRLIYLCGPDNMMTATRELLMEIGVDPSRIRTEAFVSSRSPVREAISAIGSANVRDVDDKMKMQTNSYSNNGYNTSDDPDQTATVLFQVSGKSAVLLPETTLLEASEEVGVDLPYECRAGVCGQCKVRLLSGSVTMESEDALTPAEKASGLVLACQSRSHVHVTIDA